MVIEKLEKEKNMEISQRNQGDGEEDYEQKIKKKIEKSSKESEKDKHLGKDDLIMIE